jgi:hypothetical protein
MSAAELQPVGSQSVKKRLQRLNMTLPQLLFMQLTQAQTFRVPAGSQQRLFRKQ